MPFIKPIGDTLDGNLTTTNKTFTGAINELDSDIGNKVYDYNEIVTDGESLTTSINKITTYLHNEDYSEYRYYPSWQNITKQSGILTYNITQDENSNSPYIISDYASISEDILDFEIINPSTRKAIFKQGSVLPIASNRVKVINYNNTTGVITLNFEPKENFRVVFLTKYTNNGLPSGKKIEAENGEVIVSNTDEASEIQYSNSTSGLISTDVQSSIDEIAEKTKYNSFGTVTIPTVINNGNGSITVGDNGVFNFCKSANGDDLIVRKTLTGTTLTPTDNTVNYLYADYNNGNPIYTITLSPSVFLTEARYCPISRITREGNALHFEEYDQYGVALSNKMLYKDISINATQRQTGLILSTTATRIASVTSGYVWFGVQNYSCGTVTSGSIGNMFEYYLVGGVWNKSTNQNLFDSTYYSDGTNRQTMLANRYVAKYFWRDVGNDNEIYYIHGNQYTSASSALAEIVPTVPTIMTAHSIYVGKIVIQQGAILGTAYPRVWEGAIATASATSHEDLTNILQVGTGITNGHISDQAQTIYGAKTFDTSIRVNGDINFTGKMDVLFANSLSVKDSNIMCNVDGTDVTSDTSGFDVYRPSGNKTIRYDNTNDRFNVNTKLNATTLLYNGVDINTNTALSNVAYSNKSNTFSQPQSIAIATNTATGLTIRNQTSGTTAETRITMQNDLGTSGLVIALPSTTTTGTLFGIDRSVGTFIFNPDINRTLVLGTSVNADVMFGTQQIERMRIRGNTGNVLVGTKYEITTGAGGGNANLAIGSTGNTFVGIKAYQANVNYVPIFSLGKSHSNADGILATTPSGSYLGMMVFDGVNSGNTVGLGAGITAYQNGSAGSVYVPTDLIFSVSDGSTYGEAFKINNDKTIKIINLAGTGNRMVYADSNGILKVRGGSFIDSNTNVSTSWTNIYATSDSPRTIFVNYVNTSSSDLQGTAIITIRRYNVTVVSNSDDTTLGVSFQYSGGNLQMKTTSGTVTAYLSGF